MGGMIALQNGSEVSAQLGHLFATDISVEYLLQDDSIPYHKCPEKIGGEVAARGDCLAAQLYAI